MQSVKGFDVAGYKAYVINAREAGYSGSGFGYKAGDVLVFDQDANPRIGSERLVAPTLLAAIAGASLLAREPRGAQAGTAAADDSSGGGIDVDGLLDDLRLKDDEIASLLYDQRRSLEGQRYKYLGIVEQNQATIEGLRSDLAAANARILELLPASGGRTGPGLAASGTAAEATSKIAELTSLLASTESKLDMAVLEASELDAEKALLENDIQTLALRNGSLERELASAKAAVKEARIEVSAQGLRSELIETDAGTVRVIHEFPEVSQPSRWRYYYTRLRRVAFWVMLGIFLLAFWYMGSMLLSAEASGVAMSSIDKAVTGSLPQPFRLLFSAIAKIIWWFIHLFR